MRIPLTKAGSMKDSHVRRVVYSTHGLVSSYCFAVYNNWARSCQVAPLITVGKLRNNSITGTTQQDFKRKRYRRLLTNRF